ncbi:uncharacterized protein VTP21DRAFT_1203 [Calcarisporiella thermophila]|uniref:uncharacterized protein n=1 Tax=Calcarisporiella thermophila TaxID=911321 RepID=UPI0037441E17
MSQLPPPSAPFSQQYLPPLRESAEINKDSPLTESRTTPFFNETNPVLPGEQDPLDDEDDFDWEAEAESELDDPDFRKKRRQAATHFWARLSPFVRALIVGALGGAALVAPAVILLFVYNVFPEQIYNPTRRGNTTLQQVQMWSFWAAWVWIMGAIAYFCVEVLPKLVVTLTKLLTGGCSESIKTRLEYFIGVRPYVVTLFIAAWLWGAFEFFMGFLYSAATYTIREVKQPDANVVVQIPELSISYRIVHDTFRALFGTAVILLFEKFLVQMIAVKFHRSAYKERIQENKYAMSVLDKLMKAKKKAPKQEEKVRYRRPYHSRNNTSDTGISYQNDEIPLSNLQPRTSTSTVQSQSQSRASPPNTAKQTPLLLNTLNKKLANIAMQDPVNGHNDMHSAGKASKLARKLFEGLQANRNHLSVEDFLPYFDFERSEAEKAFAIFDKDGNGDVSKSEMKDNVLFIYQEHRDLVASMRDLGNAVGKLDTIFMIIAFIFVLLIFIAIFDKDILSSLLPFSSAIVALSFVFGGSARDLFQSIIFLFVTHPYDVGDRCYIGDVHYIVHSMGLLTTTFIRWDGTVVYMPNKVLCTKDIKNVRRSGNMSETVTAQVNFTTPHELIVELRDRIRDWLENEGARDFSPGFDIQVTQIDNMNKLYLSMCIQHRWNWQDMGRRFANRTKFALAVKGMMQELGIAYSMPPQPAFMLSDSNLSGPPSYPPLSSSTTPSPPNLTRARTRRNEEREYYNNERPGEDGSG